MTIQGKNQQFNAVHGNGAPTRYQVIWIIAGIMFIFVFFLSLLEAAWLKTTREDIMRHEREHGMTRQTARAKEMLQRQHVALSVILFVIFVVLSYGNQAIGAFEWKGDSVTEPIMKWGFPILLFVVGEVVAKIIAMKHAVYCVTRTACVMRVLLTVFSPIVIAVELLTKWLGGYEDRVGEADVVATAHAAADDNALHPMEARAIERLIVTNNRLVRDVMRPFHECVVVPETIARDELYAKIKAQKPASYALVVDKSGKKVVGFVTINDLVVMALAAKNGTIHVTPVRGVVTLSPDATVGEAIARLSSNSLGIVEGPHRRILGALSMLKFSREVFRAETP